MKDKAKELNIPHHNLMPKENLQEATKGTIIKYKELIKYHDTPLCTEYLNKPINQQGTDEIL